MEHEPHSVVRVETDFNEMVSGPERAEVIQVIPSTELGMFGLDRIVPWLQTLPFGKVMTGNFVPGSAIVLAAIVRPAMRYGLLDGGAQRFQAIRQVTGIESSLDRDHAAPDVHANRGGNDGSLCRDHAADRRSDTPMDIRHGRDPLVNKGHRRDVTKLL